MNMLNVKLHFIILITLLSPLFMSAQDNAPVVTNVNLQQRTDGSMIVDIYYDVYDADGNSFTISVIASSDSGVTWGLRCIYISGDVGGGITSGTAKHIVWDFGSEHPLFFSNKVVVQITADEGGPRCIGIPTVTYAGKTYNTLKIGNQCWLKENLDVGTMIQANQGQSNNGIIEKFCYDNDPAYCTIYGGLYQWDEAMSYSTTPGTQGICPPGWHIPTSSEFGTLGSSVNGDGNALKSADQGSGNGQGTNTSGFSALLAGGRNWGENGVFRNLGSDASFWSSTAYNDLYNNQSYYLWLNAGIYLPTYFFDKYYKYCGFSVRCLKDN